MSLWSQHGHRVGWLTSAVAMLIGAGLVWRFHGLLALGLALIGACLLAVGVLS